LHIFYAQAKNWLDASKRGLRRYLLMQNGIIEKTVKIPFLALKINQLLRLIDKDAFINSEFWMQYTRKGRVRRTYVLKHIVHTPKAHGTQKPR
jgi:hypothetical protein